MKPDDKLWNFSGQTLRSRFRALCKALDLPQSKHCGIKPLDMGSLRPGGATWLLQVTESGELVMRRGRWAAYRSCSFTCKKYLPSRISTRFPRLQSPSLVCIRKRSLFQMLQSRWIFGGICSKPSKKKKLATMGKVACDVLLCHSLKRLIPSHGGQAFEPMQMQDEKSLRQLDELNE